MRNLPETTLLSSLDGLRVEKRRIGKIKQRISTDTIKHPERSLSLRVLVVPIIEIITKSFKNDFLPIFRFFLPSMLLLTI